jgi:hypothetical protein
MAHPGSWSILGKKLPDYSLTEKLQNFLYPGTPMSDDGGSTLLGTGDWSNQQNTNDGQVLGTSNINEMYNPLSPWSVNRRTTTSPTTNPTTEPGPGPNPEPSGDSGGSSGPSTAEKILQATLNLIKQRWDETKREAANWLSRANETKIGALGDIRDTTSMIKGNAIRTANDIETKNRMAARALGYGTSSAFERSMRKMGEGLSRTMGGINLDQAQGRRQVNDRYAEAENQARALENTGLSQFGDDTTSALGEFASRLDAIKQANDLIAATKGQYGQEEVGDRQAQLLAGLNNLQDFGTGLTGMNYANQPVATNVAQPTDIFSTQDDLKNKGLYSGLYV